ncbi:MAG TPA: hypothetical protein VF041_01465 [Gemmatimonadaceae bacterium]
MRWWTGAIGAAALALLAACNSESGTGPNGGLDPCPDGADAELVSLPVGGVRVVDGAALRCVAVSPDGGGDGTFLLVAANADPKPDQTMQFVMADSSGPLAAVVRAPSFDAGRAGGSPLARALARPADGAAEGRLRAMERRVLARAIGTGAMAPALAAARARATSAAALPALGDTMSFRVPDPNADDACATFSTERAVVKAIGRHGIILQDVNAPANGFTASDFSGIVQEFDDEIYPADTAHFGSPSDVDANDHVFLLFTPKVNAATKRSSEGILEGFFFGGDLAPTSVCAESNLSEVFYLLVPDPTGQFSDVRTTADVRQGTRGIIAHEFQHMINDGVRIARDAPPESVWLNEALSHFAEELVGRAEHGFGDLRELGINDVADAQNDFADFNAFFGQNLVRYRGWLQDPATLGATSEHADTSLAVRGAAWSLVRWSADHFSGGDVAGFTRALVAGPDTSVANLVARAGAPFDTLMAGWLVASFADDNGIGGLPARDQFASWNIHEVESAVNSGVFPLEPITLGAAAPQARSVSSAAAVYFLVTVNAGTERVVGELAPDGSPLNEPGARLYVLRVR